MSRQGWYRDVEEAIKACDDALEKTMWVIKNPEREIFKEGGFVVPQEEVAKIKKKLKNILKYRFNYLSRNKGKMRAKKLAKPEIMIRPFRGGPEYHAGLWIDGKFICCVWQAEKMEKALRDLYDRGFKDSQNSKKGGKR